MKKSTPELKSLLKLSKELVVFAAVIYHKLSLSKKRMTRGEDFIKRGKCGKNHCSSMSNSAWTDLNSKGYILKLHDNCPNPRCSCQKIITFTPHQYMLEGGSIKSKIQRIFRGTKKAWDSLIKPGL